jgi:hypothetical protein
MQKGDCEHVSICERQDGVRVSGGTYVLAVGEDFHVNFLQGRQGLNLWEPEGLVRLREADYVVHCVVVVTV